MFNVGKYCVVRFVELPFVDIDRYVCVPHSWVRHTVNQKVLVAYPNESPANKSVENEASFKLTWKLYLALNEYSTVDYKDAKDWIARMTDGKPSNMELNGGSTRSRNNHSSNCHEDTHPLQQNQSNQLRVCLEGGSSSSCVNNSSFSLGNRHQMIVYPMQQQTPLVKRGSHDQLSEIVKKTKPNDVNFSSFTPRIVGWNRIENEFKEREPSAEQIAVANRLRERIRRHRALMDNIKSRKMG